MSTPRYAAGHRAEILGGIFKGEDDLRDWLVCDIVVRAVLSDHDVESVAEQRADLLNESRYRQQRDSDKSHPNRKQKMKAYHDTSRNYFDVARQISDAIARFKRGK